MAGPSTLGSALFCIAMFLGPVCGAHVNPAVTVAVWIKLGADKMGANFGFALMIILSQLLGAGFGVTLHRFMTVYNDGAKEWTPKGPAQLCPVPKLVADGKEYCAPDSGMAAFNCIASETFATFVFISVVLSIKFHNGGPADALSCLAAGLTLFGAASISAPITNAAINPAVGIVQTIYQSMMYRNIEGSNKVFGLDAIYIYIVGPLLGGILAGLWSKFNESVLEMQKPANEMETGHVDPSAGYNPETGY